MELRHLRYFVAVAEERHFTRAAERLGIAQPPLSQQIKKLEQELGTPLFRRLTRGVELTEAGALFLEDARGIMSQVERARARAMSVARGESGRISIGFASSAVFHPLVATLIRYYRDQYPRVTISPIEGSTPSLVEGMDSGNIDAAVVRLPFNECGDNYCMDVLAEEEMLIVLPAHHPLAGEEEIALEALERETLIMFPRSLGPGLYDSIIAACRKAGFSPSLGQESPQVPSTVNMVAAGFGVSVVPASIRSVHAEGVTYHRIKGGQLKVQIALAHRANERSQAVHNLVKMIRSDKWQTYSHDYRKGLPTSQ
ncbi:LysR family transcriptional regulator [Zymobacter sp. IVIA_12111.31 C1]|uniref:LysR family transcriptional regulator n=1 Tax=Zymobacter sp. IVIA_12111.31 C1 TaxID=3394854 RepID=UPI0039C245E3